MLNEKVKDLLNQQINKEFYSAYLYLAFSNYFADRNLDGFANWYQVQAQEERDHAMLFLQYVKNNSEKVTLEAIECPEQDFDKDMTVLEKGLQHERYVTGLINAIYDAPTRSRISGPCSSSTGLSRSRARKRRTRKTS